VALLVVDASAVAALLFLEPEADEVVEQLRGFDLAAPQLLAYEIASVAAMRVRRRLTAPGAATAAIDLFRRLDVRLHPVEAAHAFEAATRTGLTAYDGAYLWLARALGSRLVTLDRRLARVARAE